MGNSKYSPLILLLLILISPVSSADELGRKIAMQGNGKGAIACISCHGVNGEGQAQAAFPALAGLDASYLSKQLNDFTGNARSNPIMAPIATALSKSEKKAVADYFSSLPSAAESSAPSAEEQTLGKKLAESGNWDKDIPACLTCHGDHASGITPHFPALAGQHASYIAAQLQAWKSGQRKNDPNQLMKGVADRLSDDEIKAVSTYLASLPARKQ